MYIANRHTYGESYLHLQLTPKYRRKVFMCGFLQKACRTSFEEIASHWGVNLEACDFGPDHCHIFLSGWKNFAIPKLAQYFKGASSRRLRKDLIEVLQKFHLGDSFWSDGYFYETCGSVTAEARKFYIERMQKKHFAS